MKVAIDISPLSGGHAVRGIGAYTSRLLSALQDIRKLGYEDIRINALDFKTHHQSLITNHYDLVHYPYFDLFFLTLPIIKPKKTIVTIHDVIPLIYPEHYPTGIRGWFKFQIQKLALKGVAAVITDSETSKKDIVRFLDVPEEKIHVVRLAPGDEFKKIVNTTALHSTVAKYNLVENFILYVGDLNYNKNINGLIKAFALLTNSGELKRINANGLGLVLVGEAFRNKNLPETKQIFSAIGGSASGGQLIKKLNLGNEVIMPGFVPSKDLVFLYNLATVYCQPSFYEGFGLPVLEAMACGCPVVAAKTQSLVEVADKAALYVDAKNPKSIADGLLEVISNKATRENLIKSGFVHTRHFSWERTAKETIEVYRKALL